VRLGAPVSVASFATGGRLAPPIDKERRGHAGRWHLLWLRGFARAHTEAGTTAHLIHAPQQENPRRNACYPAHASSAPIKTHMDRFGLTKHHDGARSGEAALERQDLEAAPGQRAGAVAGPETSARIEALTPPMEASLPMTTPPRWTALGPCRDYAGINVSSPNTHRPARTAKCTLSCAAGRTLRGFRPVAAAW